LFVELHKVGVPKSWRYEFLGNQASTGEIYHKRCTLICCSICLS
jgi:hypothetical protein